MRNPQMVPRPTTGFRSDGPSVQSPGPAIGEPLAPHLHDEDRPPDARPHQQAGDWTAQARDAAYVAAKASGWVCPCGEKVIVELTVYWPDRRRRDTNNCHKLLCDAIEGIAFDDDRWALVRDLDFDVDRDDPRVEVAVKRMNGRK